MALAQLDINDGDTPLANAIRRERAKQANKPKTAGASPL
jgi:hypothetical protein